MGPSKSVLAVVYVDVQPGAPPLVVVILLALISIPPLVNVTVGAAASVSLWLKLSVTALPAFAWVAALAALFEVMATLLSVGNVLSTTALPEQAPQPLVMVTPGFSA